MFSAVQNLGVSANVIFSGEIQKDNIIQNKLPVLKRTEGFASNSEIDRNTTQHSGIKRQREFDISNCGSDNEDNNKNVNSKRPRRNENREPPNKNRNKDKDSSDDDDEPPRPPQELLKLILSTENENKTTDSSLSKKNDGTDLTKKKFKNIECTNPFCDHKTYEEDSTDVDKSQVTEIKDIDDLITLGKTYHCQKNKEFNGINLRLLCNLVPPLTELKSLIGMKSVKDHMVNQILFFLQGFNKSTKCNNCVDCAYSLPCAKNQDDMLHTVITGPPGVGKTELGKILAKVYKAMGILTKGDFRLVTRADLIAKYLGQTAPKTQKIIDECEEGVMFIDEAYALGHPEGRDSFSKECLDTLNQNLTEKRNWLCIIAGYKKALDDSFFSMNEGLRRRFTFRYDIEGYTPDELKDIFLLKVKLGGWKLDCETSDKDDDATIEEKRKQVIKIVEFFRSNVSSFPNYGGDIETLFLKCKITHSRRVLFSAPENRRVLNFEDIEKGFKIYLASRKHDGSKKPPLGLYE
jgi:hypothetical protein